MMTKTRALSRCWQHRMGIVLFLAMQDPITTHADVPVDIAVVVNNSVGRQPISADDLEAVYRGSLKRWKNGEPVISLNFPARTAYREQFDHAVLGLGPDEAGRFWVDQRIRGVARPPKQLDEPASMIKVVLSLHGAIGYIPSTVVSVGMRVVGVIHNGHLEIQPP